MGELILIDRVSHATAACGVIEQAGETEKQGVLLGGFAVNLFDSFYYHPDIHTVLRHSPAPVSYQPGDSLPLKGVGYSYPADFDMWTDGAAANIRNGVFTGFGERDGTVPLLDINGIEAGNAPRDFDKYRNVAVWEKDYEI
jgi:sulfate adenylyltransferase subunit 1